MRWMASAPLRKCRKPTAQSFVPRISLHAPHARCQEKLAALPCGASVANAVRNTSPPGAQIPRPRTGRLRPAQRGAETPAAESVGCKPLYTARGPRCHPAAQSRVEQEGRLPRRETGLCAPGLVSLTWRPQSWAAPRRRCSAGIRSCARPCRYTSTLHERN